MEVNEPQSGTIQIKGSEWASIGYIIQINGFEGACKGHNSYLIIQVKGPQTGT